MYLCTVSLTNNHSSNLQQSWTERNKCFGEREFYKRGRNPLVVIDN